MATFKERGLRNAALEPEDYADLVDLAHAFQRTYKEQLGVLIRLMKERVRSRLKPSEWDAYRNHRLVIYQDDTALRARERRDDDPEPPADEEPRDGGAGDKAAKRLREVEVAE